MNVENQRAKIVRRHIAMKANKYKLLKKGYMDIITRSLYGPRFPGIAYVTSLLCDPSSYDTTCA